MRFACFAPLAKQAKADSRPRSCVFAASEAVRVLGTDLEVDGRHVRITKALDRKLYVEVNSALAAIGGKWVRGAKAHVFEGYLRAPYATHSEDPRS